MSTTTSAQPAQLTRNERLDRLPFNKAHRKLLVASGIGWAIDAMDVGLVSFVVAAIAAAIAVAAIAFGYLREANDKEAEMQYLEQPADPQPATDTGAATPEQPITE